MVRRLRPRFGLQPLCLPEPSMRDRGAPEPRIDPEEEQGILWAPFRDKSAFSEADG